MRVVLQRVSEARVRVEGRVVGEIGHGHLLLVGFREDDAQGDLAWMVEKIIGLRVFEDEAGRLNRSLDDVGGGVLVVSQFTLYADVRKGRRPSFVEAARPETAVHLYERFVALLEERCPGPVGTGVFGAHMDVELVNDGPVTLVLERP